MREEVVRLVVLQATTFCNIACNYCYLPHRNQKISISVEQATACFANIQRHFRVEDDLNVLWHSGEPLVLGPRYFEAAISSIRQAIDSRITVTFEFQTNATLLTEAWRSIYMRPDVLIGISADGPESVHNKNRPYRSGAGSFTRVRSAMDLLAKEGVRYTVICVLDEEYLDRPQMYEDFFYEQGVEFVSFNLPNREGINDRGLSDTEEARTKLREFYRYFVRRRLTGDNHVKVFQVEDMLRKITSRKEIQVSYQEHEPYRIITINADGTFHTFSPELAGFAHPALGSFGVGTMFPAFSLEEERVANMRREISQGVEKCRAECEYFEVCGGGIPSTKFFDTGTFASAEHISCNLAVKMLADVVASEVISARDESMRQAFRTQPTI